MTETAEKVESVTEIPTGSKVDEAALNKAQEEYDQLKKSMKDKLYGLKVVTQEILNQLVNFVENEAEWKAMEAFGIELLSKRLSEAKLKSEHIFLSALETEALYHFLGKTSGKGLKTAKSHIKLVQIVSDVLNLVKADNLQMQKTEGTLEAIRNGIRQQEVAEEQGIEMDKSVTDTKE